MANQTDRTCFVSIDVEHPIDNLNKILDIFKKNSLWPTLFVTGNVLEQHPDLVKNLQKDYEIACHSFTHRFWNTLNAQERKKELGHFINLYRELFGKKPLGFRAPSHVIDAKALELLEQEGFSYDSSVVPHYPPFKKYRGYQGRKPPSPYYPEGRRILEIPVSGQIFGIPLAGAWMAGLPHLFYEILFFLHCPRFIALSIHSWDKHENLDKMIKLLKRKDYQFLNGEKIYQNYRQK